MNNNIDMIIPPLKEIIQKSTITLGEYINLLHDEGSFVIPDYQRGYVWGQRKKDEPIDSVTYLIKTLKNSFKEKKEVFLQGITVHGNFNSYDINIVDGQQRTTFFYLLLRFLGYDGKMRIKYQIREESNNYLEKINLYSIEKDDEEEFQDIFFFKKTLRIFSRELDLCNKTDFLTHILDKVKFLFVVIPEEHAHIVFTMMNGNKAIMRQEELIKSELLRCSSRNTQYIQEAENINIRSRFAHEWDKWLYWWNNKDIKLYFKKEEQMGWLIPLIEETEDVSFEHFKNKYLATSDVKNAKETFRKMRLLQKSIEDAYNNPIIYNLMGAIMCIRIKSDRYSFMKWYFDLCKTKDHDYVMKELRRYFNWAFINLTHKEIIDYNIEKYNEKRMAFYDSLSNDDLYRSDYETGARWLLRCNILEDCAQNGDIGRKFDFSIWEERSLEHIYPKSRVGHYHNNTPLDYNDTPLTPEGIENVKLWRENIIYHKGMPDEISASEHSIGNLVLLYKNDNSKFNAAEFKEKKNLYFTIKDDSGFHSRHLLHTVSVFANSTWEGEDIAKHKKQELNHFINEYKEL